MFALIIAIVSIALIVATVALSSFYGGSAITDAQAVAEAARLKNEESQIIGAVETFQADQGRWPNDVRELVTRGYLTSIPRGAREVALVERPAGLISAAFAQASPEGWHTPVAGQPIYTTSSTVDKEVCRKFNVASRGDDGILKTAFTELRSQCFGAEGTYQVVVARAGSAGLLTSALPVNSVSQGLIPAVAAGDGWWDTAPVAGVKVPTDPEKLPLVRLDLTPAAAEDFGSVLLGQARSGVSHTVTNGGNAPASNVQVHAPSGFALSTNTCGASLPAGSSCTFVVQFEPSATGPHSGDVSVTSGNASPLSLPVSGNGVGPSATLSNVNFGSWLATAESDMASTLTNTGIGPLTLTPPNASSVQGTGFAFRNTTCGPSLMPGASCVVNLRYYATGMAAATGTLSIPTAAGVKVATLSGQSLQAKIVVTPGGHAFGQTQVATVTTSPVLTLTNTGNYVANGLSYNSVQGFNFTDSTCVNRLNPGASCTFRMEFVPSAAQPFGGTASIGSTNTSAASFTLSGTGVNASASTTNLDFGRRSLGTQTDLAAVLTNDGLGPVNVMAPGNSSVQGTGFSFVSTTCSGSLAPGASCRTTIRYSPVTGVSSGVLTINVGNVGPVVAMLTGQSQ